MYWNQKLGKLKDPHHLILSMAFGVTLNSRISLLRKSLSGKCRIKWKVTLSLSFGRLSLSKRGILKVFQESRSSFPLQYQQLQQDLNPPQVAPASSVCGGFKDWVPWAFGRSVLSAGHHRDWPIAQLTAAQDLESSRSLVRLGLPARMCVRACQTGRWTCNEQTCAKLSVFALGVVHIVWFLIYVLNLKKVSLTQELGRVSHKLSKRVWCALGTPLPTPEQSHREHLVPFQMCFLHIFTRVFLVWFIFSFFP